MSLMKVDRWVAVRRGQIYCAPACGGGCTYVQYTKAVKRAKALAKRMGPNWKVRVWENLGWHYAGQCGTARIDPISDGRYWADIMIGVQFSCSDKNPRHAFQSALRSCAESVAGWKNDIVDLYRSACHELY